MRNTKYSNDGTIYWSHGVVFSNNIVNEVNEHAALRSTRELENCCRRCVTPCNAISHVTCILPLLLLYVNEEAFNSTEIVII